MQLSSWPLRTLYRPARPQELSRTLPGPHYAPAPSSENNGWGLWIRGDHDGIGMDRTVSKGADTGTGFIGNTAEVAAMYTSLKTCPDNLVLFMHHEPYTYRLHNGKTVIQTIYDDHYEGAQEAAGLVRQWQTLDGLIDPERYDKTLGLLEYQAGHAIVWRDAINRWFEKMSGIADDRGRIDHDPNRITVSQMLLTDTSLSTLTHGDGFRWKGLDLQISGALHGFRAL